MYKLIEENEIIVDFITQNMGNSKDDKDQAQQDIEEEEEENILIPDEHPEQFTSLDELQQKLEDMKKLLEKKLKEEDRKKIEQLYNLYLQQKKFNKSSDNIFAQKNREKLKKLKRKNLEKVKMRKEKKRKKKRKK